MFLGDVLVNILFLYEPASVKHRLKRTQFSGRKRHACGGFRAGRDSIYRRRRHIWEFWMD